MASVIRHARNHKVKREAVDVGGAGGVGDSVLPSVLPPVPIHFNSRMQGVKQLSNFAPCMIGGHRTTVEHEYQALKMERVFGDKEYATQIRFLSTPKEAKKAGSMDGWIEWMKDHRQSKVTKKALKEEFKTRIKHQWVPISIQVMRELLCEKFNPIINPQLWAFLDGTTDRPLHEVGRPNVWTKSGSDMLGRLLCDVRMKYREVLKSN